MLINDECYQILKEEYYSGSLYLNVPYKCTSWIVFWFRINHYTIYATYMFLIYLVTTYHISMYHMVTHLYTSLGLMFHCFETPQKDYIFYYQIPTLLHLLVVMLYLEKQPFEDPEMSIQYFHIREENNKRSNAQVEIILQHMNETICKIRQYNNNVDIEEMMQQADEQLEKNLLRCQLLNYPVLSSPEKKKKNIFFIHITLFLLIVLALWNIISVFHRGSFRSYNPKNLTRIL